MAEIEKDKSKDSLTELIFIITIESFFFGTANLLLYYGKFSFNIFEYIEVSEIVTNSIQYLAYLLIPYFLFVYSIPKIQLKRSENDENAKTQDVERKSFFKKHIVELFFISIVILGLILDFIKYHSFVYERLIVYFSVLSVLLVYGVIDFDEVLKKRYKYRIPFKIMMAIFTSLLLLSGSAISMYLKIKYTIPQTDTGNSYIILKNDTIKSTRRYYYIGRTKSYVFFYNDSTQFTDVYPEKDISKMSLK